VAAVNGNPQNTLTRDELTAKAQQPAACSGGAGLEDVRRIVSRAWTLRDAPDVSQLFAKVVRKLRRYRPPKGILGKVLRYPRKGK